MHLNKGKNHLFLKIVSALVLMTFTTTSVSWAKSGLRTEVKGLSSEINSDYLMDRISLSSELGSIKEIYRSTSSLIPQSSALIVHIEEPHGQPEAQKNIERILARLHDEYGFKTIFLEGAWDKLDPGNLRFFKDTKLQEAMMEELTKTGLAGGVERFLAKPRDSSLAPRDSSKRGTQTSPESRVPRNELQAYGVEDIELYKQNLEQFREVHAHKTKTDAFLQKLRSKIADEAGRMFNSELKTFFKEWAFKAEIAGDPFEGLSDLAKQAERHLDFDLTDAREQYDWPALVRFFKLKKIEQKADSGQRIGDSERKKLGMWLDKKGLQFFGPIFDGVLSKPYTLNPNPSGDIRSAIEHFYELASPKGFKFEDYPNLTRRIGIAILSSEFQAAELFKETVKLRGMMLDKLAVKPEEKAVIERYQEYLLLKKLFALELTRGECEKLGGGGRRAEGDKPGSATSSILHPPSEAIALALDFYKTAEKREQAIFANMLKEMKALKEPNAVLVTGGYHSEGLSEFFKQNGMSYVRIAPRVTKLESNQSYLRVMRGEQRKGTVPLKSLKGLSPSLPARLSNLRFLSIAMSMNSFSKIGPAAADYIRGEIRTCFDKVTGQEKGSPFREARFSLTPPALQALPSLDQEARPILRLGLKAGVRSDPSAKQNGSILGKTRAASGSNEPIVRGEMREEPTPLGRTLPGELVVANGVGRYFNAGLFERATGALLWGSTRYLRNNLGLAPLGYIGDIDFFLPGETPENDRQNCRLVARILEKLGPYGAGPVKYSEYGNYFLPGRIFIPGWGKPSIHAFGWGGSVEDFVARTQRDIDHHVQLFDTEVRYYRSGSGSYQKIKDYLRIEYYYGDSERRARHLGLLAPLGNSYDEEIALADFFYAKGGPAEILLHEIEQLPAYERWVRISDRFFDDEGPAGWQEGRAYRAWVGIGAATEAPPLTAAKAPAGNRSEIRSPGAVKAVVFDIGNVVVKIDAQKTAWRLIEAGLEGMTVEAVQRILYDSQFYKRFETDELSGVDFYTSLSAALGLGAMSIEYFKKIWSEIFELSPEAVGLVSRVKDAGYKVFFLSDTNRLHMDYLSGQYDFFGLADRIFTSYELKLRKEDGPPVFEAMGREIEKEYGIKLGEMIFFDDREVNVRASEQAGLPGHIFVSVQDAENKLLERGVSFSLLRSEMRQNPVDFGASQPAVEAGSHDEMRVGSEWISDVLRARTYLDGNGRRRIDRKSFPADSAVLMFLNKVRDAGLGKTVFVAGGAVRDLLLGKKPHDLDLLIDGAPGPVREQEIFQTLLGPEKSFMGYPVEKILGRSFFENKGQELTVNRLYMGLEEGEDDPALYDPSGRGYEDLAHRRARFIDEDIHGNLEEFEFIEFFTRLKHLFDQIESDALIPTAGTDRKIQAVVSMASWDRIQYKLELFDEILGGPVSYRLKNIPKAIVAMRAAYERYQKNRLSFFPDQEQERGIGKIRSEARENQEKEAGARKNRDFKILTLLAMAAENRSETYPFARVGAGFLPPEGEGSDSFSVNSVPIDINTPGLHEHAEMNLLLQVLHKATLSLSEGIERTAALDLLGQIREHIQNNKLNDAEGKGQALLAELFQKTNNPFEGGTLYVTLMPCKNCQAVLKWLHLKEIIYDQTHPEPETAKEWLRVLEMNFPQDVPGVTKVTRVEVIQPDTDPNKLWKEMILRSKAGHDSFQKNYNSLFAQDNSAGVFSFQASASNRLAHNQYKIVDIVAFLGSVPEDDARQFFNLLFRRNYDKTTLGIIKKYYQSGNPLFGPEVTNGYMAYLQALRDATDDADILAAIKETILLIAGSVHAWQGLLDNDDPLEYVQAEWLRVFGFLPAPAIPAPKNPEDNDEKDKKFLEKQRAELARQYQGYQQRAQRGEDQWIVDRLEAFRNRLREQMLDVLGLRQFPVIAQTLLSKLEYWKDEKDYVQNHNRLFSLRSFDFRGHIIPQSFILHPWTADKIMLVHNVWPELAIHILMNIAWREQLLAEYEVSMLVDTINERAGVFDEDLNRYSWLHDKSLLHNEGALSRKIGRAVIGSKNGLWPAIFTEWFHLHFNPSLRPSFTFSSPEPIKILLMQDFETHYGMSPVEVEQVVDGMMGLEEEFSRRQRAKRSEVRTIEMNVARDWKLPGVSVRQARFEDVAIMREEYHSVLHVTINGNKYSIGHGDYLVLTLPSGKKIYWGGQHNLSYAFFFKHFGGEATSRLGSILWRHADQHSDLNVGSLGQKAPPKNASVEQQIGFGLRTLNATNYLGFIQSRNLARVKHVATVGELVALEKDPEEGGVLDVDLDILVDPVTAKHQDRKIFAGKLARVAKKSEVIFITNSSELQAVYPQGERRPGYPKYLDPNEAVVFGIELISEIADQEKQAMAPEKVSESIPAWGTDVARSASDLLQGYDPVGSGTKGGPYAGGEMSELISHSGQHAMGNEKVMKGTGPERAMAGKGKRSEMRETFTEEDVFHERIRTDPAQIANFAAGLLVKHINDLHQRDVSVITDLGGDEYVVAEDLVPLLDATVRIIDAEMKGDRSSLSETAQALVHFPKDQDALLARGVHIKAGPLTIKVRDRLETLLANQALDEGLRRVILNLFQAKGSGKILVGFRTLKEAKAILRHERLHRQLFALSSAEKKALAEIYSEAVEKPGQYKNTPKSSIELLGVAEFWVRVFGFLFESMDLQGEEALGSNARELLEKIRGNGDASLAWKTMRSVWEASTSKLDSYPRKKQSHEASSENVHSDSLLRSEGRLPAGSLEGMRPPEQMRGDVDAGALTMHSQIGKAAASRTIAETRDELSKADVHGKDLFLAKTQKILWEDPRQIRWGKHDPSVKVRIGSGGTAKEGTMPLPVQVQGKRTEQQDRYINLEIDLGNSIPHGKGWMFGVMDGHGGDEAADYIEKNLPVIFRETLIETHGDVPAAMESCFHKIHTATLTMESGSTLSFAYLPEDESVVYVFTVGDSPVIIRSGEETFVAEEHTFLNHRERAAFIEVNKKNGQKLGKNYSIENDGGVQRLAIRATKKTRETGSQGLELTRSFGDKNYRKFLISTPQIVSVDLEGATEDVDILIGTDGLWGNARGMIRGVKLSATLQLLRHFGHEQQFLLAELIKAVGGTEAPDNTTVMHLPLRARSESRTNEEKVKKTDSIHLWGDRDRSEARDRSVAGDGSLVATKNTNYPMPATRDKADRSEMWAEPEVRQVQGRRGEQQDRYVNERIKVRVPGWVNVEGRIMAVMDGYGGALVSTLLRRLLVPVFKAALVFRRGDMESAFRTTYKALDLMTAWASSGSTFSSIFVPADLKTAYVMTVGDSPAFIYKDGSALCSPEHSPSDAGELMEHEKRLGVRYDKDFDFVKQQDAYRLRNLKTGVSIMLTRSFGSRSLRNIMIREPHIQAIGLAESRSPVEILIASDGIYKNEAWNHKAERQTRIKNLLLRHATAQEFIDASGGEKASDNVTVIRWTLDPEAPSGSRIPQGLFHPVSTAAEKQKQDFVPPIPNGEVRSGATPPTIDHRPTPVRVEKSVTVTEKGTGTIFRDQNGASSLSRAELRVAMDAAEDVFRQASVTAMGKVGLRNWLAWLVPAVYAQEKEVSGFKSLVSGLLFDTENVPFQISIALKGKPSMGDPVTQLLTQVLIEKPFMRVQIVMPGVATADISQFQQELMKKVRSETRKNQGGVAKGVNLVMAADVKEIPGFLKSNQERALVYDMRANGKVVLEGLVPVVDKAQTLLVFDDVSLSQKAFALLAALDRLFDKKVLPEGVQSASSMLMQYIQTASEAAKAILRAA